MVVHYVPDINDIHSLERGSWAGWYEVVYIDEHTNQITSRVFWWNSVEWNHGPNSRRGWKSLDEIHQKVLGIHRLVKGE